MKSNGTWRIRLAKVLSGAAIVTALFLGPQTPAQGPGRYPVHLPTDWSHRHMVFSQPSSFYQAWQLQGEHRYIHQYLRQNGWAFRSANSGVSRRERDRDRDGDRDGDGDDKGGRGHNKNGLHKDWAVPLVPGASTGGAGSPTGKGQFPAKFTFDVNAAPSCTSDYVAFNTSVSGALQIVAFNNLYSTQPGPGGFCNTAGPSVMFAYDTRNAGDTTGRTRTSPTLSLDGTKIAYVESRSNGNGGSILHILKWKSGDGTIVAPLALSTACPSVNACVTSIIFNDGQRDSNSSPFVNYATDELYVGDDSGVLHKFSGVFLGTPTEVTTGGWPINVHTGGGGHVLTSPVFDSTSKRIFVGDDSGQLSLVREVGSSNCTGNVTPPCLDSVNQPLPATNSNGIVDPPIVDGGTERVLVFEEDDANNGSVFQFDTALSNGSKVTANIAGGSTVGGGADIHAGAFDGTYLASPSNNIAGHLYVCGKESNQNDRPAMFQLSFTAAGVLSTAPGTPLTGLVNNDGEECSPVTELFNGGTDRIFFSVQNKASQTGCPGAGCVMSLTLGGSWPPAAVTHALPARGGTSGIVIDNVGAGAQESSIYFTYQSNSNGAIRCNGTSGVGCAVKLTQSALN
jgi:hypothetical protein